MALVTKALLIAGILLLFAGLMPIRRIVTQLPGGLIRRAWFALAAMIMLFICGYFLYAGAVWEIQISPVHLVVAMVFFLGACFVALVNVLSVQTALDVRRIAELEHETITDSLTGIFNRRHFDRRLREEIARAMRYDLPLCLLLLDIDHFKAVNDELGHPTGDYVLASISKLVLSSTRVSDVVARYGGDEIAVIAPNTMPTDGLGLGERIRSSIERLELESPHLHSQRSGLRPTVSVGIAALGGDVKNRLDLLGLADDALYRAKSEGRNRVVLGELSPSTA
jgi:diguanylate cyclase (GGDEF)-like protein